MKNLAAALLFLFAVSGVFQTVSAVGEDVRILQPGVSAPVALAALDAADELDFDNSKKKKKKKKGGEEDEEEYRGLARNAAAFETLEQVDPGAMEAVLKLRAAALRSALR
jgi:hypothetical protein